MTAFPSVGVLGGSAITTADFQVFIEALVAASKQLPGGPLASNLTISGGNITPTAAFHRVDTQGAAATDDLDHAVVTNLPAGSILILTTVSSARDVVVRNAIGGSGQFLTATGSNFTLLDTSMFIAFVREGSDTWVEVFRSYGNQASAARTNLGLGTAAVLNQGATGTGVPQSQDILGRRTKYFQAIDFRAGPYPAVGPLSFGIFQQQAALTADGVGIVEHAGGLKIPCWAFSDTAGSEVETTWVPPKRWDKGNIFVELYWWAASASGNAVRWGISAQSIAPGESLTSTTFASESGITQTNSGNATLNVSAEVTTAVSGTPADREFVNIRIRRVPADAGDTLAAGANLIGMRILYNISALRDN